MNGKFIRLDKDRVFQNSVEYNDHKNYEGEMIMPYSVASDAAKDRADGVKDAIFDLMLSGKLDATDLTIIQARDCSPMPSNMDVARSVKIPEATVRLRLAKIKRLMPKDLRGKCR